MRAERWADLLKSKELPFLGDSVAAALLARMCCLPECAGGQPLDLMPGAGHVAALESLCAAALNCVVNPAALIHRELLICISISLQCTTLLHTLYN